MKTLMFGWMLSVLSACALPAMFQGAGKGHARETHSSTTTTTEEINGQPLEPGEMSEEEAMAPPKKKRSSKKEEADDFGATCKTNKDCSSKTCFIGTGNLGYCTMMCDSWSDCPSHWECQRARNAPQRICMQGS